MAFICHISPLLSDSHSAPGRLRTSSTRAHLQVHAHQSQPEPARHLNRRAFLHRALALGLATTFVSLPPSTLPSLADTTDSQAAAPKMAEVDVEDVSVGTGASPKKGDVLYMHYTLTLNGFSDQGGKVVDSSRARGRLFSYPFDMGKVIKGWDEGVRSMKVGGKRKLIVPPELGYGPAGVPPTIPGGSKLYFEIELVRIGG